jgi:hypothetical protein
MSEKKQFLTVIDDWEGGPHHLNPWQGPRADRIVEGLVADVAKDLAWVMPK